MTTPTVFVSSTCVDLKDLRASLKDFLEEYGFRTLLSEYTFPVHSNLTPLNSCVKNIREYCDIFVLIIGTEAGTVPDGEDKTIVNIEFERAVRKGVPIFIFVRNEMWSIYSNWKGKNIDVSLERYKKLVEFIQKVSNASRWIHPFADVKDITSQLKASWATLIMQGLDHYMREPYHEFWDEFKYYNPPIKILTEVRVLNNRKDGGVEPRKNINGTYGLTKLISFLDSHSIEFTIYSSLAHEDTIPVGNILLDGSHLSNPVTKLIFNHPAVRPRLIYDHGDISNDHKRCIVDISNNSYEKLIEYASSYVDSKIITPMGKTSAKRSVDVDYGLITFLKNPEDPESRCLITSGNHGAGTYGCLAAVTTPSVLETIYNEINNHEEFQAVIKIKMNKLFDFEEPQIMKVVPLRRG